MNACIAMIRFVAWLASIDVAAGIRALDVRNTVVDIDDDSRLLTMQAL
jgi:hypothetical protein